jgi:hypothetical protein
MSMRWSALTLVWVLGCGFDSSGGGAGASLGPVGDDDADDRGTGSESASTTRGPQGTSEADSMGEDGSTTNDPTTNDPTTNDPTTNDPTTNDPTTNDPTTNDDTTTTEGDDESTGDPFEWYSACPCERAAGIEACIEFTAGGNVIADVCYAVPSPPCTINADCPSPSNGTATPFCWVEGGGICSLDCGGTAVCPDGMACYGLNNNAFFRCAWPS